jgi:hypothetical protein
VRFARRRFGHYDLIDFVAVRLRYAISGERTLETFYERVQPFANAFMALFGRQRLARNAAASVSPSVSITLFGIPDAFAEAIGLKTL